jgi:hypothetical protein
MVLVGAAMALACSKEVRSPGISGSAGDGGFGAPAGAGEGGGGRADSGTALEAAGVGGAAGADAGTRDAAANVDATANRDSAANLDVAANAADAGSLESDARGGAAGTIVPLYTYPDDPSWAAIVTARKAHPSVRVVAIVNPDNGPGASKDAAFTTGIAKLQAGNIQVIGYVATGYASHSLASMQAEIDEWKTFYPQIEGIFFDEQSDQAADVPYYRTLSQYAKARGLTYTVGNPGADTAEAFVGALDTMLIYESKGLPAPSKLAGWHTKYAVTNFGVIPYGTPFDAAFVQQARQYVGYLYLQNDDLPNPWDTLPPYFGDLLAALE